MADPFDTLSDVGCATESIQAGLKILSDSVHEFFDGHRGELTKHQQDTLYDDWLLLEMIRREVGRTLETFHAAESVLYKAGVHHLFHNVVMSAAETVEQGRSTAPGQG